MMGTGRGPSRDRWELTPQVLGAPFWDAEAVVPSPAKTSWAKSSPTGRIQAALLGRGGGAAPEALGDAGEAAGSF